MPLAHLVPAMILSASAEIGLASVHEARHVLVAVARRPGPLRRARRRRHSRFSVVVVVVLLPILGRAAEIAELEVDRAVEPAAALAEHRARPDAGGGGVGILLHLGKFPWVRHLQLPVHDKLFLPLLGGLSIRTSGGGGRLDCSAEKWKEQHHHRASTVSSSQSPSGPSKRARAPSNSSQNVSCLVDGCKSDLSGCREYHRRHKVCEGHSKTPIVLVGGQEQRFCQQCSRFHLLVEFDEVKRSCRKRLDGHNRRRRKPQPSDSINSGSLFTNHQGGRYSSYPHIFPTAPSDSPWPVIVKTEEEPLYPHHPPVQFLDRQHHHFSSSFPRSFKEGKHFPFLQDSDRATLESSICQPLLKSISSAESSSSNKIFSNGLTQVLDSDCALSLLSSPPQTSSINLGQIVSSADRIPMGQPLLSYGGGLGLGRYSGSHQASNHVSTTGFSCSGMEDEHVGSTVLVSDGSDPEMNCQGLFAVGGEGFQMGALKFCHSPGSSTGVSGS